MRILTDLGGENVNEFQAVEQSQSNHALLYIAVIEARSIIAWKGPKLKKCQSSFCGMPDFKRFDSRLHWPEDIKKRSGKYQKTSGWYDQGDIWVISGHISNLGDEDQKYNKSAIIANRGV